MSQTSVNVNREPVEDELDSTMVDVIHHHESGRVHLLSFFYEGKPYQASVVQGEHGYFVVIDGQNYVVSFERASLRAASAAEEQTEVRAPMDCRIVSVSVAKGQSVSKGDSVARIESMKLESNLDAKIDGTVEAINVAPGESVLEGQLIARIQPQPEES